MSSAPDMKSSRASGSLCAESYWMLIGSAPVHSRDCHDDIALASIGEPITEKLALATGQSVGVGAKYSGITILSRHEQEPVSLLNAMAPMSDCPVSWLWSRQCAGDSKTLPPCAGTTTSEHGLPVSQPSCWSSSAVSSWMSVSPVPFREVVA